MVSPEDQHAAYDRDDPKHPLWLDDLLSKVDAD